MKYSTLCFAFLTSIVLSNSAFAFDLDSCKASCKNDTQVCRKEAEQKANLYVNPPAVMNRPFNGQPMIPIDSNSYSGKKDASNNLRFEMQQKCDVTYQRCVSACDK